MHKRLWLVLITVFLISGLWLTPMRGFAAEGETTSAEEVNTRGPGAVILMIGIASLALVGFAYSSRQNDDAAKSAK